MRWIPTVDTKLYSLIAVVETGNFTRAAERLALTQPAVSQHIRLLEEELGTRIFDRSRSTLRLTREGEVVVRYAKRMLALENNLHQALLDKRRRVTSLTVGVTHTAESSAIADALAAYATVQGDLTIKVITDNVDNLHAMLKGYELDFIIVEGQIRDPSLNHLMLDTDCLMLVTAPGHRLAKQSQVTIEQIRRERLILRSPKSSTRNIFIGALESHGISIDDFNVILEIDNIATIKDLIRRNFGVSVLAKSACMDELKKRKIAALPIEHLSMVREINIVYTNDYEHQDIFPEIVRTYNEVRDGSRMQ